MQKQNSSESRALSFSDMIRMLENAELREIMECQDIFSIPFQPYKYMVVNPSINPSINPTNNKEEENNGRK
jgi:hypothetical protein